MALTKTPIELSSTPGIVDNSNATAITIDSSENVGIGVSPEAWNTYTPLQVQLASLSGYTNGDSRLSNNAYYAGGWKYINSIPATQYLMDAANGVHTWSTAASGTADAAITWQERMRIDSSGQLIVGGTAPVQASKVGIQGGSATTRLLTFEVTHTTPFGPVGFHNGNGLCGSISMYANSVSYNTSSDYRLKENVVGITGATERLKQLNPSRFNFIADADTTVDGFLAHEVQDVVPEAITGTKDAVDADGNPEYQGIDQSKLVPLLVATIQELEARLTALENN